VNLYLTKEEREEIDQLKLTMTIDKIGAKWCSCGAQVIIGEDDTAVFYRDDNEKLIS
jgi:hypothetical protein